MSFIVDIDEQNLEYLRSSLTPQGFERLRDRITAILENVSESFREERRLMPSPESGSQSSFFELTYVFPDGDQIHGIRFVVNDSGAAYGVLKVVFIDIQSRASP